MSLKPINNHSEFWMERSQSVWNLYKEQKRGKCSRVLINKRMPEKEVKKKNEGQIKTIRRGKRKNKMKVFLCEGKVFSVISSRAYFPSTQH